MKVKIEMAKMDYIDTEFKKKTYYGIISTWLYQNLNTGKTTASPIHYTLLSDFYVLGWHPLFLQNLRVLGTTFLDGRELRGYTEPLLFMQAAERGCGALWVEFRKLNQWWKLNAYWKPKQSNEKIYLICQYFSWYEMKSHRLWKLGVCFSGFFWERFLHF